MARVNSVIFSALDRRSLEGHFRNVCFDLGTDAEERIRETNSGSFSVLETAVPPFRSLTDDQFERTLLVLTSLHRRLASAPAIQTFVSERVQACLSAASIDLPVRWQHGEFLPAGSETLDVELLETAADHLSSRPDMERELSDAIRANAERRYSDAISGCYRLAERTVRDLLGSRRTLDNNREELLRRLSLPGEWGKILSAYCEIAHEYARHGSENAVLVSREQAEAFVYLTGLLVRLMETSIDGLDRE